MNQKYIWWGVVAVMVVAGLIFWFGRKKSAEIERMVQAEQGEFEILVTVTGELIAKNFENIVGPDLRSGLFRVNDVRIQDLIPEGTQVAAGDYVAEIDRSRARNALLDMEEHFEQHLTTAETLALDSAVNLKALRDNILNLGLAIEEAKMVLEESTFEPPATIRRAEINLDKAERALIQAKANYQLRKRQYESRVKSNQIDLDRHGRELVVMNEILASFTIRAPKSGMVIYHRERSGQKRRTGSVLSAWDNVVATLPDLSEMLSRAFVNEIDISKVKLGQKVRIGVDAFPDKKYTGVVTSVSDIGEQLANTDAKVFEVIIEVHEFDPIMRPTMTTSNAIVINTLSDVTYISTNAIFSRDSIPFVYTVNQTKQVVVLGESNENESIIEQGLSPGDRVYVSIPDNSDTWKIVGEELIPIVKERALEKKKREELNSRVKDLIIDN